MYTECVIAEFDSEERARMALEVLEKFDFTTDNVSVVSRYTESGGAGDSGAVDYGAGDSGAGEGREMMARADAAREQAGGGESSGLGAVLAGSVVTPIALSTAVGPFMIFGPIAAMIGGAMVGGVVGSAKKWGVDPEIGRTYDQRVADGSVLVIVADEEMRVREAEAALKTAHPETIQRFAVPQ